MSSEICLDGINDDALFNFVNWTLETGLWNGRTVTWKEASQFHNELEQRVIALLFSEESDFEELLAQLAWFSTPRENRSLLARDIEQLVLSPDGGGVLPAKHHKHHKHHKKHHHHHHERSGLSQFWHEHKTGILIGAGILVLVVVVVVVTTCSAGTATGGALAGGAAVLNNGKDSDKKVHSSSSHDADPPPLPPPNPIAAPQEQASLPFSLCPTDLSLPGQPAFFENGLSLDGQFFPYDQFLQDASQGMFLNHPTIATAPYTPPLRPEEMPAPPPVSPQSAPSLGDTARNLGARFAHDVVDGLATLGSVFPQFAEEVRNICVAHAPEGLIDPNEPEIHPLQNYEQDVAVVHQKIDELFGTDQAKFYTPEAKANDPRNKFVSLEMPPPWIFSKMGDVSKLQRMIQGARGTAALAEELGLASCEIAELEQAGTLEKTVESTFKNIVTDRANLESFQKFRKAEDFLKQQRNRSLSEAEARELIHQCGIETFPRPEGIPKDFVVKFSNEGAGMKYVHPENPHISVRIMPGKPHSPFPYQRKPYVIHTKHGQTLDKFGNIVKSDSAEAHIPINEFVYKE